MTAYFAHSPNGLDHDGVWETVRDHLQAVATTASKFASAWNGERQAYLTGLLHDLGKYSDQFQNRLRVAGTPGKDHWTLGALAALGSKNEYALMPATAILGHHVGLDELSSPQSLGRRLHQSLLASPDQFTTTDGKAALGSFRDEGFEPQRFDSGLQRQHDYVADMLDTRMLFSALVDADFLETEAHFNGDARSPRCPRPPAPALDPQRCLDALDRYTQRFDSTAPSPLSPVRARLLGECRRGGDLLPPGNYTLSAPTGAGKTLAMLAFALHHARACKLRRIVLVMPFLNIIDQTAAIYREIFPATLFGDDYVLEAHSLAGEGDGAASTTTGVCDAVDRTSIRRRLLSENWDAPIILTTSVQLLESLFAHKPSKCRKLHRLARSVILFDEVQTLPPKLAAVTLAALARLCDPAGPYGSTVVFATATQPALEVLSPRLNSLVCPDLYRRPMPAWAPREIVPDANSMFQQTAVRVTVDWRDQAPVTFEQLAAELIIHPQVLCIVNLKRHAVELTEQLRSRGGDVLHLSTNMCSRHRLETLAAVRNCLDSGAPVALVATQCVEAGVDLDFPVVYRALAPLDAIAQAAGRCNRSGRRSTSTVTVFTPQDEDESGNARRTYPPGYDSAVQATRLLLAHLRDKAPEDLPALIHDPVHLHDYFRLLYNLTGRDRTAGDDLQDEVKLLEAIRAGQFAKTAEHYRLIDQSVINILVPFDRPAFEDLVSQANDQGRMTARQIRRWERLARPHSVSLYRPRSADNELYTRLLPILFGLSENESGGPLTEQISWWYPASGDGYAPDIGLSLAEPQWVM